MDMPRGRVPEATPTVFEDVDTTTLAPLDPTEALDLHRAINERRAQMENPELLRGLRAL